MSKMAQINRREFLRLSAGAAAGLALAACAPIGKKAPVKATAHLGALGPDDVQVEIVYGEDRGGHFASPQAAAMTLVEKTGVGSYRYQGELVPQQTGALIYGVRILPHHPNMLNKHEMALVAWAT